MDFIKDLKIERLSWIIKEAKNPVTVALVRDKQRNDIQRKREWDDRGRGGSHRALSQGAAMTATELEKVESRRAGLFQVLGPCPLEL